MDGFSVTEKNGPKPVSTWLTYHIKSHLQQKYGITVDIYIQPADDMPSERTGFTAAHTARVKPCWNR